MANIKVSGFTLAKGKELKGDDAFEFKRSDEITIAILCDGVGSADFGAQAAQRVCSYMLTNLKNRPLSWSMEKSIKHFIKNINNILYVESIEQYDREELVTTLALVVIEGNRLYGANVGDSRIYLYRSSQLTQLSQDHHEEDEMEGVLSQAIGISADVDPYYFENNINQNDKILLCSDGLYTTMNEDILASNINVGAHALVKKASLLMQDNLPDDTTAVIVEINQTDQFCLLKQQKLDIPEHLKEGEVIDGYKLNKALVQNERTWECEQHGQKYVIKFPPYEALEDKKLLDLFVKEAWNAKRLKAGFFPKAVIPKNRTQRYYIMQKIEGDEIKKYLKRRLLSIDEGVHLAIFLLHMSQFLLKYDLVHGDIKPENIIRAQRKGKTYFKMIDFGSIVEIFSINSLAGTPSYLAPERFKGHSIDEKTEIFAIGVTLYESLSGKLPFGEIEPFQKPTFKAPKRLSKLNPKVPKWLENIIHKAISPDENRRYQHFSEMLYDVEHPEVVKAFYNKNTPILERDPIMTCRVGFVGMFILNLVLLYFLFVK